MFWYLVPPGKFGNANWWICSPKPRVIWDFGHHFTIKHCSVSEEKVLINPFSAVQQKRMSKIGCCSLSVSIIKIIQGLGFVVHLSCWDRERIGLVVFGLPSAKTKVCV